jgi:hypothetical protein
MKSDDPVDRSKGHTPRPLGLGSLGALTWVELYHGGSSDFLGDPPADPRFLASLGALSWVAKPSNKSTTQH